MNESTSLQRRAILLIVLFTIIAAIAQPLFKIGANSLPAKVSIGGVVTDLPLIAGLALYGLGSILMIWALRHGELSVLYPLISLSYVWVAILSVVIFRDRMTSLRISGIATIIAGVSILGIAGRE
ncbi:MAG TPA: EamA family transporter [Bryobacteraceae bacterium]|nr:EamA family transporter [Bryobacteraceae bacterium]